MNEDMKYYEQSIFWGKEPILADKERVEALISLIPEDVSSILDAGCGDGILANRLILKYEKVVGIERSKEALQYVKTEKQCGSIDFLPFSDASFDLIVCSEVLEHLPLKVFQKAILELQRVAKKYIIISVPNNEPVEQGIIKCNDCGCIYNSHRHLRSFDSQRLQMILCNYKVQKLVYCGPITKDYNNFILKLKRCFNGGWWNSKIAICPQCGSSSCYESRRNLFSLSLGFLNRIIPHKKRKRWLIGLFKRISREK